MEIVNRAKSRRYALRFGVGFSVFCGAAIVACVGSDPGVDVTPTGDVDAADPNTNDSGTTADSATTNDAEPGAPCDLDAPFGNPVLVPVINAPQDDIGARLSADELAIFFGSTRPDGGGADKRDIYVATRNERTFPFGQPSLVVELKSDHADSAPMLAPDGLTLFFESTREGSVLHDIWVATRTPTSPVFSNLTRLGSLDNDSDERTPYLSVADNTLWFASNRHKTSPNYSIYRAKRSSSAGFEAPEIASEVSTDKTDWYPVLSGDGLTLYWASDRTDGGARGGFDIWTARRSKPTDLFGTAENVTELNTADHELPTWLSPDGCRLYLQRNAEGVPSDIFMAEKPRR